MLIVLIAISSNPSVAVTEGGQVWSLILCLVYVGKKSWICLEDIRTNEVPSLRSKLFHSVPSSNSLVFPTSGLGLVQ